MKNEKVRFLMVLGCFSLAAIAFHSKDTPVVVIDLGIAAAFFGGAYAAHRSSSNRG